MKTILKFRYMAKTNKVILLGNVGKDPFVKEFSNGKVARITLATTEKGYTKQDGTKVEDRTEWHDCVAWNRTADVIENYVKKGDRLFIVGTLRHSSTEKDGVKTYRTEVHIDEMEMLGGKGGGGQQQSQATSDPKVEYQPNYEGYNGPANAQPQPVPENDELPF